MKNAFNIFLIFSFLMLSTHQTKADDETKRIIGGLAASLIGTAISEMARNDKAQATEDVQWTDEPQQRNSGAAVSEKTKNLQRNLKELGYYHGTVDGISGSGTQQAILEWEKENCEEDDNYCRNGKLDQIDLDYIEDLAENERNNRKIAKQNAQLAKEHAEEEKILTAITEKDVSDWIHNLSNAVKRDALFPICKSKAALSDLQDVAKNSAYSNFMNVQVFDLIDATEVPNNIDVLLKEYGLSVLNQHPNFTVKDKTDTAPVFKDKRRLCIANAVTNSGNVPIRYSFHVVEGGVSDDQKYYVEYQEIEENTYDILKSPKFYKRLYVNNGYKK